MDVVDLEGRASRLQCPALPSPAHLLGGLFRWDALAWPDRLGALRLAVRSAPEPAETVAAWLRRLGQTPRLVELLWEPLALAALNQPIGVAAAAPFAEVLERMLRTRLDASIAVPAVPLRDLFAMPARGFLEARGGTVLVDSPARLVPRDDGETDLTVRGVPVAARAVIAAVEWHGLAGPVSVAARGAADGVRRGGGHAAGRDSLGPPLAGPARDGGPVPGAAGTALAVDLRRGTPVVRAVQAPVRGGQRGRRAGRTRQGRPRGPGVEDRP